MQSIAGFYPLIMKFKFTAIALGLALSQVSYGVATLQSTFGILNDSSGATVSNDTLWVLIVDTNNDNSIWGTALDSSISTSTANSLLGVGQSIDLGSIINGDTIFAMGGVNEAGGINGYDFSVLSVTLGVNGTAAGLDYAFAWFPGVTFSGTTPILSGSNPHNIGSQVGMINRTVADSPGTSGMNSGMALPGDGGTITTGAVTSTVGGGGTITTPAHLTAVNLVIPEPSTMLLGALGSLLLLRRSRTD